MDPFPPSKGSKNLPDLPILFFEILWSTRAAFVYYESQSLPNQAFNAYTLRRYHSMLSTVTHL